jgi:hypothetical protein
MSKAFLLSCIQIPSRSSLSETQVWHVLQFPFCRLGACVGSHWSMHNLEWEKLRLSPQTKFLKHCHILNSGLACSTRRWFLLACISHFKVMISSSLPISFLFWSSSCSKNTLSEKQWTIYYSLDKKIGSLSLHWINIDLKMKEKCNGSVVDITVVPNFIFYNSKVLKLLQ